MLQRCHTMFTPWFAYLLAHSLVLLGYMYAMAGRVFEVKRMCIWSCTVESSGPGSIMPPSAMTLANHFIALSRFSSSVNRR